MSIYIWAKDTSIFHAKKLSFFFLSLNSFFSVRFNVKSLLLFKAEDCEKKRERGNLITEESEGEAYENHTFYFIFCADISSDISESTVKSTMEN